MKREFDVAVVGAGPAGAMAAHEGARLGLDVALIDREPFPRDKVCGDALLPDALQALREAGLFDEVLGHARMVRRAMVRSPRGHTVSIGGGFITIPRVKLDALLFDAAVRSGATPMTGVSVGGPLLDQNACVGVVGKARDGSTVSIRSRYVVLACGSAPKLLATFGVLTRAMHSAVAVRGYLHEDPFPELADSEAPLLIAYDRDLLPGYGWSFPLPDGQWNVGCGVVVPDEPPASRGTRRGELPDLRAMMRRFLNGPAAAGRSRISLATVLGRRASRGKRRHPIPDTFWGDLRGATLRTGFTGARASHGRVLVAGESLGLTLPLTGDGIGKAMTSGLVAAQTLSRVLGARATAGAERHPDPGLAAYEATLEERLRFLNTAYAKAEKWMRKPFVPDIIVSRAARSEALRRIVEEIVAENTDPRRLISGAGILRAIIPGLG